MRLLTTEKMDEFVQNEFIYKYKRCVLDYRG